MTLTLDRREGALSEALRPFREHFMKDLPVGDVHCRYDDGTEWILERKTVRDLANSIRRDLSGR
jgi:ERCC4-type nuclease